MQKIGVIFACLLTKMVAAIVTRLPVSVYVVVQEDQFAGE